LQALRRLFLVDVNLQELGNDLDSNGVIDQEWFSIVESFIESFEKEKELVQLLCTTQLHVDNPEETQSFSKSFFRLMECGGFEQISTNISITREEYYERLLMQTGETVEAKIRLTFSIDEVKYFFDFAKDALFTIMQIEIPEDGSQDLLKSSLDKLASVRVIDGSQLSLEELSYQLHSE
jgi:hypothetical protein